MLQRLNRYYPIQLELVPLALLVLIFYLFFSNYAALPERVPTHFGLSGEVDGWGAKTQMWLFPIMGTVVYLLFGGINLGFASVKDARSLVNMPEKAKAAMTPQASEVLRVVMLRSLLALKIVVLGMLSYLLYSNLQVALGKAQGLGSWFPVLIVVLLGIVAYMLFRTFRLVYSRDSRQK